MRTRRILSQAQRLGAVRQFAACSVYVCLLIALAAVVPVHAQDSSAAALSAAGCGPADVKFDAKTDKNAHPVVKPDAGKAMVYVIGDTYGDNVAVHIGTPPTRIGIDGTWVSANGFKSYSYFQVEPGDHRLCTDSQVIIKSVQKQTTAALSFTAEAGQSYYFRTVTPVGATSSEQVAIEQMDPAQALVMISRTAHSTFTQKK